MNLKRALDFLDSLELRLIDRDLPVNDLVEHVGHVQLVTIDLQVILDLFFVRMRVQRVHVKVFYQLPGEQFLD